MLKLSDFRIKFKLWSLVSISMIGTMILIVNALIVLNSSLIDGRKLKTQHVVESAYSIIEHFGNLADKGKLDLKSAQSQAIEQIKSLRYDGENYFWINDYHPNMIMHPYKPKLDGKDLSEVKDPKGKKLFVAFADKVKNEGQGFVDYLWPKPGFDEPVEKISYVKGYEKWQWIVGSGIYLDDVKSIFWQQATAYLLILAVLAVVQLLLSYIIIKGISNPINHLRSIMDRSGETGDLTEKSDIYQSDESGMMAKAYDSMLDKFRNVIRETNLIVDSLNSSSDSLTSTANQTAQDVNQQQFKTDQIATAINEMSATVQEVANSAELASASARDAYTAANNGNDVVKDTVNAIGTLAEEVIGASDVINKLESDSNDIGRVLDVIRGIAEQTNLLALNAAIEAARAGEQGRGFAVVADEVRSLAQRTQESTQEIQSMIETLQAGAQDAGKAMHSGRAAADACTEKAAVAGQSLQAIIQAVDEINSLNTQIASAAEEQSAVAEDINQNVTSISEIANQSAGNSQETASTCGDMQEMIQQLERTVHQFKAD